MRVKTPFLSLLLSPGPIQSTPPPAPLTVSDVDSHIGSQLSEMSTLFDRKLEALQVLILINFSSVQSHSNISMSARLPQSPFTAPLEVPVPGPAHGLEASPHEPEKTVGFNREFQASGVGQVPSGFRTPFPMVQGECSARVGMLDSNAGQSLLDPPIASVPHADVRTRTHVHFSLPSDASPSAPEQPEEEDNADSVASHPLVVGKTLVCLAGFIHERYPESRPLSSPLFAPWCGFESLYVVSDPLEPLRLRFRLYPRIAEIIQGTRNSADSLAKRTKPLSSVLPKKRRLHSVADEPEFASPQVLNPGFSRLVENKSILNRCMSSVSFFELERLEGCTKALLEANSYSLWLMSSPLS